MPRVTGIDHLSIRVSDYQKSKHFYARLFTFLGFPPSDEYDHAIGRTNGKTRFWISPADTLGKKRGYRIGDIGFHHYAFHLHSRHNTANRSDSPARRFVEFAPPGPNHIAPNQR